MSADVCLGCGEPLPPGSPRGRRARYHGAACRQRARRARLQAGGSRSWEAVERADAAMAAVRRTLSSGTDPQQAIQDLLTAVTDLAEAHGIAARIPTEDTPAADTPEPDVTECITEPVPSDSRSVPAKDEQEEMTAETTALPRSRQLPRPIGRTEMVDLDTVRMERSSDFEQTRRWIVLCGAGENVRLIGYLDSGGTKAKKWQALGPMLTRVSGGPCRTKQDALLRLLDPHVPRR